MTAKNIMFQGTGSHVGKSVIAAALCRILYQDGYRVAPFKSQNMALNSFVTKDGGEMGRAQVVQAEAAGIEPHVDMNPILLKPTGNATSQVVVLGRPVGNMTAKEYHLNWTTRGLEIAMEAYRRLAARYDVIVIEGAGSPAEINLRDTEIVNMRIAKLTGAPVVLVGDIDKGGVLAQLVGTLELLTEEERELVAGFIINKFRGDVSLFQPAVDFLEKKTGKPVLGIVPYFQGFRLPEEDSVLLEEEKVGSGGAYPALDVAVIRLPRISNFTDFDPLEEEPDVRLRYVHRGERLGDPDLIIIPGSKNTIEDLLYLRRSGLEAEIVAAARRGVPVIGICGGFQMLGEVLADPLGTESTVPEVNGLGLLPVETVFEPDKVTCQVEATVLPEAGPLLAGAAGMQVEGYEIHMGRSSLRSGGRPAFCITSRRGEKVEVLDGACRDDLPVFGTYIHGIFDNDKLRRHILDRVRERKGLKPLGEESQVSVKELRERNFNLLADTVRKALDMEKIYRVIGL